MAINSVAMALADPTEGNQRASRIPDDVKKQLEWAKLLQKQDTSPVYSDTVGAGRAIMQGLGGYFEGLETAKEGRAQADYMKDLTAAAGANAGGPSPSPVVSAFSPANSAPSSVGGPPPQPASDATQSSPVVTALAPSSGALGGQDEMYLANLKAQESGGNMNAQAATSSARGPYQFTEGTWSDLATRKPELGLTPDGRTDPAQNERAIAAFTAQNRDALAKVGAEATPANLYMSHFLGTQGGPSFIANMQKNPNAPASQLVTPQAARANPTVFFKEDGSPRTAQEVYDLQTRRFAGAPQGEPPQQRVQVASADPNFVPGGQPAPAPMQQAGPQVAQNGVPAQQTPAAGQPSAPDRIQALQRVIQNPRATNQERAWALQQLSPEFDIQKGADGSLYALDKRNPGAGMKKIGSLPIEQFQQTTNAQGVPVQRNSITGKDDAAPQKEASQSDVEYAQKNWQTLRLPDPKSQDPKDQEYWKTFSSKRLGGSGVSVSVNNDHKAETAEANARGTGLGKRLNDVAADGTEASMDLQSIGRMRNLMSSVDPGAKTAMLNYVRSTTGVALDPNASNVQAANALVDYMVPRQRVVGSGASSDKDMAAFRGSLPNLMGTPEGNTLVMDTLQGLGEYRKARADIAVQWQVGDISAKEANTRMDALPDPFAKFKALSPPSAATAPKAETSGGQPNAAPAAQGRRINSKAEFDALKSGDTFIDPNGDMRTKP